MNTERNRMTICSAVMIFLIAAYQVLFLLSCTIWRNVVDFPGFLVRPELTRPYLEQYFDAPQAVPYEQQLLRVLFYVRPAIVLLFSVYVLSNLFQSKQLTQTGRWINITALIIAVAGCILFVICCRTSHAPYYLYKSLILGEILSILCVIFMVTRRRYRRQSV